jgi:hypothetical protein
MNRSAGPLRGTEHRSARLWLQAVNKIAASTSRRTSPRASPSPTRARGLSSLVILFDLWPSCCETAQLLTWLGEEVGPGSAARHPARVGAHLRGTQVEPCRGLPTHRLMGPLGRNMQLPRAADAPLVSANAGCVSEVP